MTKAEIQENFKDLSIDKLRLYIGALTELLYKKLIAEKLPVADKTDDTRQITIMEELERINNG